MPAKTPKSVSRSSVTFRLKVPDFIDELPVMLIVKVRSSNIGGLVSRLDVVYGDRAILDQLLGEEGSQRDGLCPRGICVIAGHMKRRRVVDVGGNTVEPVLGCSLVHHLLPEDGVFHCKGRCHELRFHC